MASMENMEDMGDLGDLGDIAGMVKESISMGKQRKKIRTPRTLKSVRMQTITSTARRSPNDGYTSIRSLALGYY